MYVDDPVASCIGSRASALRTFDVIIAWWLCLGLPLSWPKGLLSHSVHRWIGVDFSLRLVDGLAAGVVTVPPEFSSAFFELLTPFAKGTGHASQTEIDSLLGKAGRIAYLVPSSRPWVGALWGALAGSKAASRHKREAPPDRYPRKRFSSAARWLQTLLRPPLPQDTLLPLEHLVLEALPVIGPDSPTVHVDASPWGYGLVLHRDGKPVEYVEAPWQEQDATKLRTRIGIPDGQTSWEYLAILLGLLVWGTEFRHCGLAILGDNLASLSGSLTLRGRGQLTTITKELSWRKVRLGWRFAAGHLPSEHNQLADSLSRLHAPASSERKSFPPQLLNATRRRAPEVSKIWVC